MNKKKPDMSLLQAMEKLESERRKDATEIQLRKQQTIREVLSWNKEEIIGELKPKKLSLMDKLKRIFGR